jgi:hypothetical protein
VFCPSRQTSVLKVKFTILLNSSLKRARRLQSASLQPFTNTLLLTACTLNSPRSACKPLQTSRAPSTRQRLCGSRSSTTQPPPENSLTTRGMRLEDKLSAPSLDPNCSLVAFFFLFLHSLLPYLSLLRSRTQRLVLQYHPLVYT